MVKLVFLYVVLLKVTFSQEFIDGIEDLACTKSVQCFRLVIIAMENNKGELCRVSRDRLGFSFFSGLFSNKSIILTIDDRGDLTRKTHLNKYLEVIMEEDI